MSGPASPADAFAHHFAIDAWLHRHGRWVLFAIVAASIGVRSVYFLQLNASPSIELHRLSEMDMHYYDTWSRQIARGDWFSAHIVPPMHQWHPLVAEVYLAAHPEIRATLAGQAAQAGAGTDIDALVWSRWMKSPRFYEDPLYPYLIALTYRLVGDNVRFVFAWQMALGVVSNVLIWLLARRCFGDIVAACAGTLAVLAAPLVYYELILLRETTMVFAGLALVWLADRALSRGGWMLFAALGVSMGLVCLLRSSFVLLDVGVLAGIALHFRRRWREAWVPAAALAAGIALALTPLMARNRALGVPSLALASTGGLTFMISNGVNYAPEYGFYVDVPRLADLMGETGGALVPAVIATLRPHTIASYAKMLWRKWDAAFFWFEIPNNDNFYYMRLRAPVLAWLPVTFWLCSPLALVGLALSAPRFSRLWLLYLLVACTLGPLLVFYTLGRFRVALLAALIPFSAFTLVELVRWTANRRYVAVILAVVTVIILATWSGQPLQGQPLIRAADWLAPSDIRYEARVEAALDARDPAGAASAMLEFFQYEPDLAHVTSQGDPKLALTLAKMHDRCALFLRRAGQSQAVQAQVDQAAALFRLTLRLDPANVDARGRLAGILFNAQAFEEAAMYYKGYLRSRPDDLDALSRVGIALEAIGKRDEALLAFRHAAEVDPRSSMAQTNLANALLDRGNIAEAAGHAEQAVALSPDDPAVHDLLGRVRESQGKLSEARAQFEKSLRIDPSYAAAREHLRRIGNR